LTVEGVSSAEVLIAVNQAEIGAVSLAAGEAAELEIPSQNIVAGINAIAFSSRNASDYSISRVRLVRPGDH
jgi:hypothetical protein